MLETRVLPPEEWFKVSHTDMHNVLPYVEPQDLHIVVVEDGARIVGVWGVMRIVHLEGVWIDPEYRGRGSVARRLLRATLQVAKQIAPRWVMTAADNDGVRRLITKHLGGVHVPGDSYIVSMENVCR